MTPKTTTKAATPRTSRRKLQKKSHRINRQRRLQKQLQILLLERHSRRCIICHHPERDAIEEEFVHWRSPSRLAHDYKLGDYRTIYRHARAAGLLLQRRERLHSALDAFVESVDDVTFTGDTILRAMRAYSCIDSHGRWTEIPTQVQFSTSHDGPPPQPHSRTSNVSSDVIDIDPGEESEENEDNVPEEQVTALDVLDVIRKYSSQVSRSDATACSVSPKIKSRNDATSCAASPAQAVSVTSDDNDELDDDPDSDEPDDDSDADEESEEDAENALGELLTSLSTSSKSPSRSDTTACAASPAQALPRDVIRGQNPIDRSSSDRTACAASPRPSRGTPAQPAAPPKPKLDADGFIWHPRPGYPDQEVSEPNAQGRVAYKIHMTTAASQLPSRETDVRRPAELIYRSVIKKYGNP
jgi:hypothetical protein